ncbi:MAG: hypothetical protein H6651_04920 [Ardenticatenales bacterium]|nr:hypothetical protein [Ardenticatenales bacterium]
MNLHGIELELQTASSVLERAWAALWAGWEPAGRQAGAGSIQLALRLGDNLPPPPAVRPLFEAEDGTQAVYAGHEEGDFALWFPGLAHMQVATGRSTLSGTILPAALGQWQTIILAGLAPLLRRRQLFLVHGFGVQRGAETRLLLGPRGAGKSAAGLAHLLAGWTFLGNDAVLLSAEADGVYAWPTPGELAIRPDTLTRLPAAERWLLPQSADPNLQLNLDVGQIRQTQGGRPARVSQLFFVQQHELASRLGAIRPVQALGQLMTHSIDRWDAALFAEHAAVLRLLVEGAACRTYWLGPELGVE